MPLPPFVIFAVALTLAVRFSSDSALTDSLARSLDASPASLREASPARSGCARSAGWYHLWTRHIGGSSGHQSVPSHAG
jgi:hypothetical protein